MIQGLLGVMQFLALLLQLLPDALKAYRAYRDVNGHLTFKKRADVVEALRKGVETAAKTKDTSELEALFRPKEGNHAK